MTGYDDVRHIFFYINIAGVDLKKGTAVEYKALVLSRIYNFF